MGDDIAMGDQAEQPTSGSQAPQLDANTTFTLAQVAELLKSVHEGPAPRQKQRLPELQTYEGKRSEWESWRLKAESKLAVDGNAIGTSHEQFQYLHSRLGGSAANMVRAYVTQKLATGNGDGLGFLEYLDNIYGDPQRAERALAMLYTIKQKDGETFATFLPRFESVLSEAGGATFLDSIKISALRNAINVELATALIGTRIPSIYAEVTTHFHDTANQVAEVKRKARGGALVPVARKASEQNQTSGPEPMDWEPTHAKAMKNKTGTMRRARWVSQKVMAYRREKGLCLRCGNPGHLIKSCTLLPPTRPADRSATTSINKIDYDPTLSMAEPMEEMEVKVTTTEGNTSDSQLESVKE